VGDCVSFRHPADVEAGAVKRVVGVAGDFVEVGVGDGVVQVPEGHCWLVGDNLPHSRDSRVYGPIPLALIRGKVVGRIWPRPKWIANTLQKRAD
jgi:mitochondrial inner membrane protease subunit 1